MGRPKLYTEEEIQERIRQQKQKYYEKNKEKYKILKRKSLARIYLDPERKAEHLKKQRERQRAYEKRKKLITN